MSAAHKKMPVNMKRQHIEDLYNEMFGVRNVLHMPGIRRSDLG